MSGGSYRIDPETGEPAREGKPHQRPGRAERRAAQHAAEAEADQAKVEQTTAGKGRKGRKGRDAKHPGPSPIEAGGEKAVATTPTPSEE